MNKCKNHYIEYGQEAGDFEKNMIKMRCLNCGYKSYSILRPIEVARMLERKETGK